MDESITNAAPNVVVDDKGDDFENAVEDVDKESVQFNNKSKSTTSDCWKYFTKVGMIDDGKERAMCNGCNKKYIIGGKKYGTSHLKRHIDKCSKLKCEDVRQMILDGQGKLKARKTDPMVAREMCANAIIEHGLPFNFVDYRGIRAWINYLNPDAGLVSRNTVKSDVLKIHMREKNVLKEEFRKIRNKICLTSDLWTSLTGEGYIALTAHYVATNWKLCSKILNFCHFPPPHTGFELSKKIIGFLHDWEIEKRIFSLTLDNASSNDVLVKTLKSELLLQNALVCDGEFLHVRCCACILNLIVQEGLKALGDFLDHIKDTIKYVRGSESRMIKFKQCIQKVGDLDAKTTLCLDVPIRWNSTFLMLQSAIKYQRVFGSLHLLDENYMDCMSEENWARVKKICVFLSPFYEITNMISASSYPTSNLYFLQVWNIQTLLMDSVKDDEEVIRDMAERMMVKFDKYWNEYSCVLAFGAILDPRMKLETLGYCYEKIDPLTCEVKIENMKKKLYKLFSEYDSKTNDASLVLKRKHSDLSTTSSEVPSTKSTHLDEIIQRKLQAVAKMGRNELDIYLDETTLNVSITEYMDTLEWWKSNSQRFPYLSIMARDLLSIPITTMASESAFSIGSRILNKYRSRLLLINVEAIICTSSWKHEFNECDDDVDEDGSVVEGSCSSMGASNNPENVE